MYLGEDPHYYQPDTEGEIRGPDLWYGEGERLERRSVVSAIFSGQSAKLYRCRCLSIAITSVHLSVPK